MTETTHVLGQNCPHCGALVPAGGRFCTQCGSNVSVATSAAPPAPYAEAEPEEAPAAAPDSDQTSADDDFFPWDPQGPPEDRAPFQGGSNSDDERYGDADRSRSSRGLYVAAVVIICLGLLAGGVLWALGRANSGQGNTQATGASSSGPTGAGASSGVPSAAPSNSSSASPSPSASTPTLAAGQTLCPASGERGALSRAVSGNKGTSCDFAESLRAAYVARGTNTTAPLTVKSPVTGRDYTMTCSGIDPVRCIGGTDDGVVVLLYK